MSNIAHFADHAKTHKLMAEKRKIVQAFVAQGCMAKFHECRNEADFLKLLKVAGAEIDTMPADQFENSWWWAGAVLFARRNEIDTIDGEFCRGFNIDVHHATTLVWAEKYLHNLPVQYAVILGAR